MFRIDSPSANPLNELPISVVQIWSPDNDCANAAVDKARVIPARSAMRMAMRPRRDNVRSLLRKAKTFFDSY